MYIKYMQVCTLKVTYIYISNIWRRVYRKKSICVYKQRENNKLKVNMPKETNVYIYDKRDQYICPKRPIRIYDKSDQYI